MLIIFCGKYFIVIFFFASRAGKVKALHVVCEDSIRSGGEASAAMTEDSVQRWAFKTGVRKIIKNTKMKAVKTIGVGYKINWIRELDSKNATFKADFKLFYYWQDDFFKGGKKGAHLDVRAPGAFWPDLIIANEAELHITHEDFYLRDPAIGAVKLSQYYRGTMTVINMSLHYFPFDIQNLRICVRPHKATISEVRRLLALFARAPYYGHHA